MDAQEIFILVIVGIVVAGFVYVNVVFPMKTAKRKVENDTNKIEEKTKQK